MTMILLAGMPGSGKEEFISVAKERGFDVVRMGDVVRRLAEEENVLLNEGRGNVGQFAHDQRELHHYGIWAERTLKEISQEDTIIDGVRGPEEVGIFKAELQEDLQIVSIHSSPKTRFERLKERGREDSPDDWEEFVERDERELDWGLGKVIARADKMIENKGSLQGFRQKIKDHLDERLER